MALADTRVLEPGTPTPPARRSEVIDILRRQATEIAALGATGLYLYGSAARDELTAESDVDVFIDYDRSPSGALSLIELIKLQNHLARLLSRNVDLTTRQGLHPLLREEIERTSIRIF